MVQNFDCIPGVSQKLIPRYKESYQVSRVLRNDRYVLTDVEDHQLTNTPYYGIPAMGDGEYVIVEAVLIRFKITPE